MARLSDMIERMLKEMIEENNGSIEITRGELAERVNCVPSQITYVLTTRFTNGQGYLVESRRGGGGWIRIHRVQNALPASSYLMHVINSLEDSLSQQDVTIYIQNFMDHQIITPALGKVLSAATCNQSLGRLYQPYKDRVRMDIFKNMLLQLALNDGGEDYES